MRDRGSKPDHYWDDRRYRDRYYDSESPNSDWSASERERWERDRDAYGDLDSDDDDYDRYRARRYRDGRGRIREDPYFRNRDEEWVNKKEKVTHKDHRHDYDSDEYYSEMDESGFPTSDEEIKHTDTGNEKFRKEVNAKVDALDDEHRYH